VFALRRRSRRALVRMGIAVAVHAFDAMAFRRRFADDVGISVNQIKMSLRSGSTIVEMDIATVSGTFEDAQTIVGEINALFPSVAVATERLELPIWNLETEVSANEPPATPPVTPTPTPPPSPTPAVPHPAPPGAPPHTPNPPHAPAPHAPDVSVATNQRLAVVLGVGVSASLVGLLGMGVWRRVAAGEEPVRYRKTPAAVPATGQVVYAAASGWA
jgi:hypothetical protein